MGADRGQRVTQQEIINQAGISQATVARWFNYETQTLDADTVSKFAKFFDCEWYEVAEIVEDK